MAIPPFGHSGLLPVGHHFVDHDDEPVYLGHDATLAEAEDRFVTAFAQSLTRATLFNEVRHLRTIVLDSFTCPTFLISGEFVTSVDNPHELLLILNVPGPDLMSLSGTKQWLLDRFFNSHEYKFGADDQLIISTGIARSFPAGHDRFEVGRHELTLARLMAGRPIPDVTAGYIEIFECEGGMDNADAIFETMAAGDQPA